MNDPMNPYAAPSSDASLSAGMDEPQGITPASQGARLANLIIDYIAQSVIGFGFGMAVVVVGGESGVEFLDSTPGLFIGVPILLAYYFLLEATTSQTLGKMITGTKVVDQYGGKPTMGQIAGRCFCRLIPFEAFSFFGSPPRGWHDSIPKTYVVKSR